MTDDSTPVAEVGAVAPVPEVEIGTAYTMVRQPHGGALRRGNPGNSGKSASKIAQDILTAAVPEAALVLKRMALDGVNPLKDKEGGIRNVPLTPQDRVKAINSLLDRGGAPARKEITGADGAPFTVAVLVAKLGD